MKFGYSEACLAHETGPRHPESPDRLRAIREELSRRHGVEYADPDPADRDALEAVHDPDYVSEVESFCAEGGGQWDPDTVAVEESWDAILASAGIAQWAAERALAGDDGRDTPFALGRPPGHHAVEDDAMGFCFANNVAIGARAALREGADGVAIFDWDVHHGNGTQDVFYEDGEVLFASIHEDGIYPGTGDADETGEGDGAGTTLNVPMPAGAGDAAYRSVVRELVAPVVEEFDPDLLLVSAGFDAHRHDPISRMRVSTEGYGLLASLLDGLAEDVGAGLGFVLEGGYGLDVLAESIATVNEVFDGYEPAEPTGVPDESARARIDSIRNSHPALDG